MISVAKLLLAGMALLAFLSAVGCGGSKPTPTSTPEPTFTPGVTATPTPALTVVTPPIPGTTETPTTTPNASPSAGALVLTLDLASGRVERGEEFSVVVNLDPLGRGVSGVQLSIEYDSTVLRAVGAEPGELLGPDPAQAGPTIDHARGIIDYAAARIGPTQRPTSPGSFATLRFRMLEGAPAGAMTAIRITETKIPDENIRPISDVRISGPLELQVSP